MVSTRPTHDREGRGINHDNETKDAEENIAGFSETGFGDPFEMEHWLDYVSRRMTIMVQGTYWVNIDQRDTGKAAHQCDEFIKIIGSKPSDACAKHDDEEAENVLLPFNIWIVLPTSSKEFVLCDSDGWEDLERC